ncbi:MAG: PH domain-containing protein [Verrucomicrobiales bacterium]
MESRETDITNEDEGWDEAWEEGGAGIALPPDAASGGERLLYSGHPSWLNFWRGWLISALALGGGAVYWERNGWILFAALLLTFAVYARACLLRAMRHYLVTDRRVELIYGLVSRSSHEVRVQDVRTINVSKPGFKGLLGVGSVDFCSAGGDGVEVQFCDLWRPHRVKALVRRAQDA